MGVIGQTIKDKLTEKFNPSQLEVIDESHKHAHHAGAKAHAEKTGIAPQSAESHFHVRIRADSFDGQGRLARHRAVMEMLSEELAGPVHALSVEFI